MSDPLYLVEHVTPGELDNGTAATRRRAEMLENDRRTRAGVFRREGVHRCPKCAGRKGKEPPALATTYVGPGGVRGVLLPARQRSDGHGKMTRVPARVLFHAELLTGIEFTQCRGCLTFYVVTATADAATHQTHVHMIEVLESTFGAVHETAHPSVVHKVAPHPILAARVHATRAST